VKNIVFVSQETTSKIRLKLGRKKYTVHYTFLPAKRVHNASPESFQSPSVEVSHITVRGKRINEDDFIELTSKYKEFIQEEALKLEWQKRVDAIVRILEGKKL
jgi:hypothetical protein